MSCKMMNRERAFLSTTIRIVFLLLPLFGLLGCSGNGWHAAGKTDEIVSFYTSSYGMSRSPVYAFSLYRKDEVWFFSASCHIRDQSGHYTSFGSFPIPSKDAQGFLALLHKEGEIGRLKRYREPILTRLFHLADSPAYYSGMTFAGAPALERNTRPSPRVLDYLYGLAKKHYRAAESVEIHLVSIRRESTDPALSCSFTLETDGYDWFLSFVAAPTCTGSPTQAEALRVESVGVKEILRIVREQQLVTAVKGYEKSEDEGVPASGRTTCMLSFRFADGSSATAPIGADTELIAAFYSLAQFSLCSE